MKKKIYLLLILLLTLVCAPVQAKGDNGFYADDDVILSYNRIDTTTFAAGNNVDVSSEIDGASFIAGNNLTISSTQDYIFAAGNNLDIQNARAKDAFLAGSSIKIKDSAIRDLYAMGETVRIDSDISRNAYLGGSKVIINATIDGDVTIAADEIVIGENAVIAGTLKYPEDASINIASTAQVSSQETYESTDVNIQLNFVDTIWDRTLSFLSILLIALILLALNKKVFKNIEKIEKSVPEVLKNLALGFAFLIVVPIVAFLAIITIIGLPLSIISLLVYGMLIYLSVIPTAYYFGNWILKDKISNPYLLLTVSLLAIYILKLIPVIGGFTTFISLLIGLGIYVKLIKNNIKEK